MNSASRRPTASIRPTTGFPNGKASPRRISAPCSRWLPKPAREKEKTGIKSLKDAKGKVVNIGNPGSGNRQNAIDVFEAAGINIEKDLKAESIKAADAPRMLQDGRIDGFFYTVGHPNGNIKEATAGKRKTRIVSITDIEPLVKKFPYYSLTNIDMAQYPEATNANLQTTAEKLNSLQSKTVKSVERIDTTVIGN